jgi:hypothetical protein
MNLVANVINRLANVLLNPAITAEIHHAVVMTEAKINLNGQRRYSLPLKTEKYAKFST